MLPLMDLELSAAPLGPRIDELGGVQQPAAVVALVAPGLLVAAVGTRPLHEPIRQVALLDRIVELFVGVWDQRLGL